MQGRWKKRKKQWAELGLNDSVGRDKDMHNGKSLGPGGFKIHNATTSLFDAHLADVVRSLSGRCSK